MSAKLLSETWPTIAQALGDHLWQSTLFALAAGLLTLLLRKNHARARYWLWLAASLKFLVPFSLLVILGSHLPWTPNSSAPGAHLYSVMSEVSQPFSRPVAPATPAIPAATTPHLLPIFVTAFWLCGFLVILSAWCVRWRKVSAAIHNAIPLHQGRELEALRRMERIAGIRRPINLLLSSASLEPGIFGITRPVLLWPERISEHLGDAHLEAIFAHEVCHVRRRDNLAAATHMLVQAILWFHPLVWWLGARLVEERERACDEQVLQLGSERHVYAESILKTCEFCAGFPLACVSGVTGADLKKRIVHIMTQRAARKLDFSRKLLLGAAGSLVLTVPIIFGLLTATPGQAASQLAPAAAATPVFGLNRDQPPVTQVPSVPKVLSRKGKICSKSARKSVAPLKKSQR
jgi:bla regulator protein blaR1